MRERESGEEECGEEMWWRGSGECGGVSVRRVSVEERHGGE